MQITIRTGVPLPAHQLAAKAKPEYTAMANQMKAMAVGDSFEVSAKEASTIRYIAKNHDITLASRTLDNGNVGFWKKEYEAPKPRKPRAKKDAAAAETAQAQATGTETAEDGVDVEVDVD